MSKRRPTSPQIYSSLRTMIMDFGLFPGSRVTEQELADQFKVSRTPVREALQRLAAEGYVDIRPKQGCFIRPVDVNEVAEHYDVRVALEGMTVELACRNMSDVAIQKLADFWNPEGYQPGMTFKEHVSLVEESFHTAIAEGCGNPTLAHYLAEVNARIRRIRRLGFPDETSIEETYVEHFEICQLLLARDERAVREAMVKHIRKSQAIARDVTLLQMEQHRKSNRKPSRRTA